MSRVSLKRFKNAKVYANAKSDVVGFISEELANFAQEIDQGFKDLRFEENFAGKVVEVSVEAFKDSSVGNPLGVTPNGFLVLLGDVPFIQRGGTWDRTQVSFTSQHGAKVAFNGTQQNVTVDTTNDSMTFEGSVYAYAPMFREPMKIIFRDLSSGTLPTGLSFGVEYWIRNRTNLPFDFGFSLEKQGPFVNITGTGSGTVTMAAVGALRIVLLK